MRRLIPTLCLLAVLAACAAPTAPPARALPEPEADTCAARPLADLVGQDATALERVLLMRQVRVIRPGMAVTMDFRPERINFEVGSSGRIVRLYCG